MAFILSKIKFFHRKVRPEQDVQLIIDVEEYLPEELAIDDIDHTLYDIGLVCIDIKRRCGEETKCG